jgi:hypothetical protein
MGVYRQFISVLYRIIRMVLRLFLPLERSYNDRRNRLFKDLRLPGNTFLIMQIQIRGVT